MCGVVGFWDKQSLIEGNSEDLVRKMSAKLSHRGPDDGSAWIDSDAGLALGHQRLAIQDLSPAASSPCFREAVAMLSLTMERFTMPVN